MFYNGKAKTCSTNFLTSTLVNSVKSFKNSLLTDIRNTNTCILYIKV